MGRSRKGVVDLLTIIYFTTQRDFYFVHGGLSDITNALTLLHRRIVCFFVFSVQSGNSLKSS